MFEAVVAQGKMLGQLGAQSVVIGLREEATADDLWRLAEIETHLVDQSCPDALGFSPDLSEAIKEARLDLLRVPLPERLCRRP